MDRDQYIKMGSVLNDMDKKAWKNLQANFKPEPLNASANIESLLKILKIRGDLTIDNIDKIKSGPSRKFRLLYSLATEQKDWFNEELKKL